jgi:alpha-L-fucosidase
MTPLSSWLALALLPALAASVPDSGTPATNADGAKVMPIAAGPFQGNVESLKQYKCPDWFRNAKFGIWAHWGPQAVPGHGDWYARKMYIQGDPDYISHLKEYGHPSKFGYKDIIPLWKAEHWDPTALIALYKKAGAHYFVSMGCHHDDFDLWNSTYHSWNAVKMGPKRDIVGGWQKAAKAAGLPFGVSEHLGASYNWYEPAHLSDTTGPLAGVPYDGANPAYQELYHAPEDPSDRGLHLKNWYTSNPVDEEDWQRRIHDLIDQYHPDLLYSDGGLPFGAVGEATVAHLYNTSMAAHGGKLEAVYNCKDKLGQSSEFTVGTCVQDVERGIMPNIQPYPWQTDTSNGDWFYRKGDKYKTTAVVLHLLTDIVSKNGNLLLNIVLKPDGSLPPESKQLLDGLSAWMAVNSEAIFGTRPWVVYGEGPTAVKGGAFKENFSFTAQDVRFTTKGGVLYAICMGVPTGPIDIKALAKNSPYGVKAISGITLLGSSEKVAWKQGADALVIQPAKTWPTADEVVFKINGALPPS